MKKMYRFLFAVAAAATALVGCVREPEMLPAAGERTVCFTAESIETRTAFDDPTGTNYPTLWTENDTKVKIMNTMFTGSGHSAEADVTPSADGTKASLVATLKDTTTYTFFALSPASAFLNSAQKVKVNDEEQVVYRLGVTVPTSQTPTAKSVDEAAQILVAQSETFTQLPEAPEKVSLLFKHWTSYGKMTLSNLALNGAKIEAVDITSEVAWAGRWYYFFADGSTVANAASNTITVNTTSASDIWFACAPVDLSGKKLTVTVKTDKGTLTKEVTMPANREFKSGQIARFTVNMSGITIKEPVVYELVTKAEDLTLNSKVIIAAAAADYNYAISTNQTGNNRSAAEVAKADNKITDPSSSVEIFTLEEGADSDTRSFKGLDGKYIYAPGGGNYLRSKTAKDASGSWSVTFKEGYVIMESKVDKDQRFLRFNLNAQNNSPLFSCYKEDGTVRDSVAIYKLVGSGGGDVPPVEKKESGLRIKDLQLTVNIGESKEIEISAIDDDYDGTVTFASDDATVATVDEDGMVLGVKAGTCNVTVTAPETDNFKPATKTCAITVVDPSAALTIAQVLKKAEGKLDNSLGSGDIESGLTLAPTTVVAIYTNNNNSNIILKDDTGVMLAYKNNAGVAVGEEVTMTGKLQNYFGVAEFVPTEITKTGKTKEVTHGTPVVFDLAAIDAYQTGVRTVQFIKFSGVLPTSKSSAYVNVGSQKVRIYNTDAIADSDLGKQADVLAYAYGYHSQGYLQVIVTSYEAGAVVPFLTVDATSKTWAASATDAFTVNVTVEEGGNWSFTSSGMDWATLTKSGNTLVVTPKAANTSSAPNEGSIVFKNDADATKTATVEFKQSGVVTGSTYVLDSDAIKAAHTARWNYDSGDQTITATDGSTWVCYNTYGNAAQVTVQMRPASNSQITTPTVPSGKKITHLAASCSWNNDGSGGFESTRTLFIKDGNDVVVASITCKDLYEGVDIPGNHTQLSFGPTASGSGTIYVLNATVTFE